jgi:FkbM family methyltransferase
MKPVLLIEDCLRQYEIKPSGIPHIGAGFLEEAETYQHLGFGHVVWVEASPDDLERRQQIASDYGQTLIIAAMDARSRGGVEFHVSSNIFSSSLLPFGTHSTHYPEIVEDHTMLVNTITGGALIREHPEVAKCNVLSIDVQGVEFRVMLGFGDRLHQFDCIYSEVYLDDVYVGCGKLPDVDWFLSKHGFVRVETWIKPKEGWGYGFWMKKSLL